VFAEFPFLAGAELLTCEEERPLSDLEGVDTRSGSFLLTSGADVLAGA
jgi:hypothetical protein